MICQWIKKFHYLKVSYRLLNLRSSGVHSGYSGSVKLPNMKLTIRAGWYSGTNGETASLSDGGWFVCWLANGSRYCGV